MLSCYSTTVVLRRFYCLLYIIILYCNIYIFLIFFFRHLHHWGWCQHIWAVLGEDSLWRGACCSHTALSSSHIPSCIGPENRNKENRVGKKKTCVDEAYSHGWYTVTIQSLLLEQHVFLCRFLKWRMFALCVNVWVAMRYTVAEKPLHIVTLIYCYWGRVKLHTQYVQ